MKFTFQTYINRISLSLFSSETMKRPGEPFKDYQSPPRFSGLPEETLVYRPISLLRCIIKKMVKCGQLASLISWNASLSCYSALPTVCPHACWTSYSSQTPPRLLNFTHCIAKLSSRKLLSASISHQLWVRKSISPIPHQFWVKRCCIPHDV